MNIRQLFLLLCGLLPMMLLAQTEAESSTAGLDVRTSSGKDYIKHTFYVGDRVRVVLRDSATKVQGRITAVRDSSISIYDRSVPIAEISFIKSPPESQTLWGGNLLLLLSLGAGFAGWIFLRAMIRKTPDNWWQWTLVALGLLLAVFLLPFFFLFALLCWAFASRKYLIGKGNYLQVRHGNAKVAPREPIR